jgi:hypothetical protein
MKKTQSNYYGFRKGFSHSRIQRTLKQATAGGEEATGD